MDEAANTNTAEASSDHTHAQEVEARLLHALDIYPQISPSMMQVIMNPMPAGSWRPVLEQLIAKGEIIRFTHASVSPAGRYVTNTILQAKEPKLIDPAQTPNAHIAVGKKENTEEDKAATDTGEADTALA